MNDFPFKRWCGQTSTATIKATPVESEAFSFVLPFPCFICRQYERMFHNIEAIFETWNPVFMPRSAHLISTQILHCISFTETWQSFTTLKCFSDFCHKDEIDVQKLNSKAWHSTVNALWQRHDFECLSPTNTEINPIWLFVRDWTTRTTFADEVHWNFTKRFRFSVDMTRYQLFTCPLIQWRFVHGGVGWWEGRVCSIRMG